MSTRRGSPSQIPESAGTGASPGFTFGRSGNSTGGTYLSNESVPSNLTGIPIELATPRVTGVVIINENSNTFNIKVEEHDGTTFTTIGTFSVTASRSASYFGLDLALTPGRELAASLSSGAAKNVKVVVYVKGDAV